MIPPLYSVVNLDYLVLQPWPIGWPIGVQHWVVKMFGQTLQTLQTAYAYDPKRCVTRMSFKYRVGPAFLVELRPLVLYPKVTRQIEHSLVQDHGEVAYDLYNEDIEAFQVADRGCERKLSTVEEQMPRGWSPETFRRSHKGAEQLDDTEADLLQSLENELNQHDLSKHVIAKGWFDLAYVSLD